MAKNQSNRLLTNSLFNLLPFVNQLLIGLLLVPFVVRHLGDVTYGTWALISSLLAYSMLLTLALNSGVNRWVPMLHARGDKSGIDRVVSTVLCTYSASAALLCLLIAGLVYGFPHWFSIPPELARDSQIALVLVGGGFVCLVQSSVFSGVLSGVERYDLLAASELSRGLIEIAGVIAVLYWDGGIVALGCVYGGAQLVRAGLSARFAFRALPGLRPRLSLASLQLLREMLAYSLNTFLFAIQDVLQRQIGIVLIGVFITASAVTDYAMPTILVSVLAAFVAQLTSVTKPAASRMDATGEVEPLRDLFLASSKLSLMIALPIGVVFVLFGDRLLMLWLAEAYSDSMAPVLAALAVSTVFWSWVRPAYYIVVGLGKHRLFGQLALAKVLLSTAAAVAGLSWLGWSTFEVAVAFALPDVIAVTFALIPYCAHSVGLSIRRLARESIIPALLANGPVLAALWLLQDQLRAVEGVAFVLALAGVGVLAPIGFWLIGLTRSEKRRFLQIARIPLGPGRDN